MEYCVTSAATITVRFAVSDDQMILSRSDETDFLIIKNIIYEYKIIGFQYKLKKK